MVSTYERALANSDIREILKISSRKANKLLKRYGVRTGGMFIISQKKFRGLQMDGSIDQWMSEQGRNYQCGSRRSRL